MNKSVMLKFSKLMNKSIHLLKRLKYGLETSSSGYYNFSWYENQIGHLRIFKPIYESWEQLWHKLDLGVFNFSRNMINFKFLKMNWKLYINWSDNILYLELWVSYCKSHFFNNLGILATGELALLLWSCSCYNHFSWTKDKTRCFGVTESHDNCCKSIRIILCCFSFPCNLF